MAETRPSATNQDFSLEYVIAAKGDGIVMTTVLLVEDDGDIAFAVKSFLEQKGLSVIWCEGVQQAVAVISPSLGLALLDLNLPDGNGYSLCRAIKSAADIPVIFLTVRDDESDIVQGLDMGADDYIVKPFQLSVLWSRINAVLRRSGNHGDASALLHCGHLRLDSAAGRVWSDDREVQLTAGEYRLLLTLMQNKNRTMTRAALLERLWDMDGEFVNDNTLTVTMKRLRYKLDYPDCIRTLRGLGYRMEDTP